MAAMAKKVTSKKVNTKKAPQVASEKSVGLVAYEVSLVVSPNVEDDKREKIVEWLRQTVVALGGQVDKTEEAGKKVLAYPIKKFNEAWYYFFDVSLPGSKAKDLNTKISFEEGIIRHLVVRSE